ncbi:MAG: 50S ribosomal protein L18 [Candidatus Liptonbacteria bacterium]|nr:50S ribosomal protein L18 [Candidatus Liptonbacteria bacterium]
MNPKKSLNQVRTRRTLRVRAKIFGSAKKPRLAIFRSHRSIYGQLIDDETGKTLASASNLGLKADAKKAKTEAAVLVGEALAKKAHALGVKEVVLDRRSYRYHGRVKAFAEGLKKAGIKI